MRSRRQKEWVCAVCSHRYEAVSLGETCPRDNGVLIEARVLDRYPNDELLGQCFNGRYQLFDILGIGGFGTVYRCFDHILKTEFALKTILEQNQNTGFDARKRFHQEARILKKIQSDHVVKVHDTGEKDGILFMVLELIHGRSLKQHLGHEGPLEISEVGSVISQVLSALEHTHGAGLIHRDLKPSNILFTDLDAKQIKLIDFGIAKALDNLDESTPHTRTGLVIGTVQYMAPEQLRTGIGVGIGADLYAVGVLCYELLSGHPPFQGSQAEVAAGHLYQKPPPLDGRTPKIEVLADWLETALAKEPEDRFLNAEAMRQELIKCLEQLTTYDPPITTISNDTIRMEPDLFLMQVEARHTSSEIHQPGDTLGHANRLSSHEGRRLPQDHAQRRFSERLSRLEKSQPQALMAPPADDEQDAILNTTVGGELPLLSRQEVHPHTQVTQQLQAVGATSTQPPASEDDPRAVETALKNTIKLSIDSTDNRTTLGDIPAGLLPQVEVRLQPIAETTEIPVVPIPPSVDQKSAKLDHKPSSNEIGLMQKTKPSSTDALPQRLSLPDAAIWWVLPMAIALTAIFLMIWV